VDLCTGTSDNLVKTTAQSHYVEQTTLTSLTCFIIHDFHSSWKNLQRHTF